MDNQQKLSFRLMTYNIGRGRKDQGSELNAIVQIIEEVNPDILVLQEATEYEDADTVRFSDVETIVARVGGHAYFGPTLSMRENMHVYKALFLHALFNDWVDWKQGNAILSRWEYVRLGDPSKCSVPRNVPLYQPPVYEGNRDTEPRCALIARVNRPPLYPFVVGVHLTTLIGERERGDRYRPIPGRYEEAQSLRLEQVTRLITLLKKHVLDRQETVFILGDFNAMAGEPCITVLEERGFTRLKPDRESAVKTHVKASEPIDHLFVYTGGRALDYRCWIVDSPIAQQASDHLPVIADIDIAI